MSKKHYKLNTHHLGSLIGHVELGGTLQTHDDVPDDIRQQLYAEEQQRMEKRRADATKPPGGSQVYISSLWDVTVNDYCAWQQSRVHESLKAEFRKARDMVLAEGLDLEQVHEDQDSEFLIKKGVKRGIARRFVGDIEAWAKRVRRDFV